MAQMTVSLSDGLKDWADARVSEGRYASTSAYVSDLMRRDQDAAARDTERLRVAWVEGLASGDPVDGNFDAQDIARRGAFGLEGARERG